MTTGLGLLAKALVVGLVSMPVRGRHRELSKQRRRPAFQPMWNGACDS